MSESLKFSLDQNSDGNRDSLRQALATLRPYFKISPWKFFADLIITAVFAWGSLLLLSYIQLNYWLIPLLLICYTAFYRGNALIHEVVHFHKKVRGLGLCFNLCFGFLNRIPFYMHEPHRFHHLPRTFGTLKDPEYLVFKGRGLKYLFLPLLAGVLTPLVLTLRFGVWPLVAWMAPSSWRKFVFQRISTIVVNPAYVREIHNEEELKVATQQDLGCAVVLIALIALGGVGILPMEFYGYWYLISASTGIVNIYRARVAHRYDNSDGRVLNAAEALRDSVTIEGSWLSVFWAPIGLKYHSLHHLAPQIPYYNLRRAHYALKKQLDESHPYSQTILPSFSGGLRQFRESLN